MGTETGPNRGLKVDAHQTSIFFSSRADKVISHLPRMSNTHSRSQDAQGEIAVSRHDLARQNGYPPLGRPRQAKPLVCLSRLPTGFPKGRTAQEHVARGLPASTRQGLIDLAERWDRVRLATYHKHTCLSLSLYIYTYCNIRTYMHACTHTTHEVTLPGHPSSWGSSGTLPHLAGGILSWWD